MSAAVWAGCSVSLVSDVLPLVVAAAGLLALWLHWRAAKTPEVRRVLTAVRTMMDEAIAVGGLPSSRFLSAEAQNHERDLADLIGVEGKGQLHDGLLRDRCGAVLDAYRRTFGSAPPDEPEVFVVGGAPSHRPEVQLRRRGERLERQVRDAQLCRESVNRALSRVDAIERFIWRRS